MLRRIFPAAVAAFVLAILTGCASKQSVPELPPALGSKGLLVARLYVLGMHSIENASINIDGKLMASSMRDGYIAVALEPGEHNLSQIRASGQLLGKSMIEQESPMRLAKGGGAPHYVYVPGGSYTIHYTTLAVNRTFQIQPGKVTNLGLMVYLPVQGNPDTKKATVDNSREFRVFALNNSEEINAFLEINYPELIASLQSREITLAPAKYMDSKSLPALRRAIAFHESRGPNILPSASKTVVYGKAGTIVAIGKEIGTSLPRINVVDTGTLADIVGGLQDHDRYTFLTSDSKLLSWDGSKVITPVPFPYHVQPVRLNSLGEDGLIVVDNHLRVMTLQNAGEQWKVYEEIMSKTPRNDIDVVTEKAGAYISLGNRGLPENVYFLPKGGSVPQPIGTPNKKIAVSSTDIPFLVARDSGLFILYSQPDFYFRSKTGKTWQVHSKPQGKCKPMIIDSEGINMAIECDGAKYKSANSGAMWTREQI